MTHSSRSVETASRRHSMLLSAFSGVIRDALCAEDVIEILANPDGSVWIERAGVGLTRERDRLDSAARERIIRLVASSIGEACDRSAPIVSAELPGGGERFEGILPPVSSAPCFAIRKASAVLFGLEDYVRQGALSSAIAAALRAALAERQNILIAGGTSSGKTTFANALLADASLINDRIVVLEDTRELQCAAPNALMLRTHRWGATLADLVRSTMRLRPDRIVVGEVRGGEALDLLKAWNTGHPGGVTTLHANSAAAALIRLEQLIAERTPVAPRALIADAIDIVVFLSRRSGARRVEEAVRVLGLDDDHGYRLEPLAVPKLALVTEGETHAARYPAE